MLTPHIDPSVGTGWRGFVRMNPRVRYQGKTFWDIALRPIAEAVNDNLGRGTEFLINVQGEMGTSMFGFAGEFLSIMDAYRDRALLDKPQFANQVGGTTYRLLKHPLNHKQQILGIWESRCG